VTKEARNGKLVISCNHFLYKVWILAGDMGIWQGLGVIHSVWQFAMFNGPETSQHVHIHCHNAVSPVALSTSNSNGQSNEHCNRLQMFLTLFSLLATPEVLAALIPS